MKRIALIFLIILISRAFSIACSCAGPDNFCTTINTQNSNLIIKGVKVSQVLHGMKVKIIEVLRGTESNDTIMVWGDDGALCRLYTSTFSVSDTLILALHYTDFSHNALSGDSIEQAGDYHISACGWFFLNVINDTVVGRIYDPTYQQMAYTDFKTSGCIVNSIHSAIPQQTIEIYPNPFSGKTTIEIKNKKNGKIRLTMYAITGQVIKQIETDKDKIILEKQDISSGMYFYQINYDNGQLLGQGKLIVE